MNKEDLKKIITFLKDAIKESMFEGHVYAVGGCVRDMLLDRNIKDIDIAVDIANGGIQLATYLHDKLHVKNPIVSYPNYGTAKLSIEIPRYGIVELEFVQCRKEWYTDGSRKPSSIAVGTIEEDAIRRDLTINALYLNITTMEIKDPTHHGLEDIQKKLLRTTNDPKSVFKDDPLRMLRVIRFRTQLGWGIEKNTFLGIIENHKEITKISKERIRDEFNKILLADVPSVGINMLRNTFLLSSICPLLFLSKNIKIKNINQTLYEHSLNTIDSASACGYESLDVRLAALLHDMGKILTLSNGKYGLFFNNDSHEEKMLNGIKTYLEYMKYSNKTIENIIFYISHHMIFRKYDNKLLFISNKSIRKIADTLGSRLADTLKVINANEIAKQPYLKKNVTDYFLAKLQSLKNDGENIGKVKLPINGNDIMSEFHIKSGPKVKEYLDYAKDIVFEMPKITKEELLVKLKNK